MGAFNFPHITLTPSADGLGQVVSVHYLIDHPNNPPRIAKRETMWSLATIPGFMLITNLVDVNGRKIKVQGGCYEDFTPEEGFLVKERRFEDLARIRAFRPTLPIHFEVLGLPVPDDDHEWVLVRKRPPQDLMDQEGSDIATTQPQTSSLSEKSTLAEAQTNHRTAEGEAQRSEHRTSRQPSEA